MRKEFLSKYVVDASIVVKWYSKSEEDDLRKIDLLLDRHTGKYSFPFIFLPFSAFLIFLSTQFFGKFGLKILSLFFTNIPLPISPLDIRSR